ncbi:MAG: hypothetical protein AABZ57_03975, partial [Candidatus Margulisiibacteriota bacterium]
MGYEILGLRENYFRARSLALSGAIARKIGLPYRDLTGTENLSVVQRLGVGIKSAGLYLPYIGIMGMTDRSFGSTMRLSSRTNEAGRGLLGCLSATAALGLTTGGLFYSMGNFAQSLSLERLKFDYSLLTTASTLAGLGLTAAVWKIGDMKRQLSQKSGYMETKEEEISALKASVAAKEMYISQLLAQERAESSPRTDVIAEELDLSAESTIPLYQESDQNPETSTAIRYHLTTSNYPVTDIADKIKEVHGSVIGSPKGDFSDLAFW